MRAVALRYALAPASVLLAVLLHLSPAGSLFPYGGLFFLAVVGAAWFGGAGPGCLTAALGAFALPQLMAASHTVLGGFLDLPRLVVFSIAGLAVAWWSFRRRQVEAALRESEKRYELAMNASEEGFWDWVPAGDKLYLSPRFLEMFDFPPGTTFASRAAFFERWPLVPEDREALKRAVDEHFAGTTERMEFEFRALVRGEIRWIHSAGRATRDVEGRVVRWNGAIQDVTARRRAEEALRVSEERHARAMEASAAGHWDWNMLTDELFVSERAREMFELPSGPVPPTRTEFLSLMSKYRADMDEGVEASLRSGIFDRVYRVVLQTGSVRWLNSRGKVYKDAAGTPVRMTGSVTDITERKLALDELRESEDALRESEARYERVVAATEAGFWDWDVVQDQYYVSPRLLEMVGLPPDTIIADRADFQARVPVHPEDLARWQQEMQALFASGESRLSTELRLMPPAGTRWVRLDGMCFRDAAGKVVRWTGSAIDVTPRKLAEEALRESEERYERAMDSSDVGYFDWIPAVDKIYTSPRLLEIYGFAPGTTFAGRNDLLARIPFHPEDRPALMRASADHIAGRTARYNVETRFIRDGETRWVSLTGMAWRDASGAMVRWSGTVRDVTERKRSELALRQSEERYELAMAASESGYWDWHIPSGRYFASPRAIELAGFPPGTKWVTRDEYRAHINMHPEDFARWEAAREALFAGTGERLSMEVRYIVHGEARWHILHAICRRDETGKVTRWTGSATDITERKLAAAELESMERKLRLAQRLEAMGTLAGGIAHDFNNILGAILAYGEMGLRDAPEGSRLARDLNKIMTAGERGRALIDRVLTFSRSAVGERVPVRVEPVVREALDLVSAKLPPGVSVRAELHAGPAAVLADATQVHQVVTNLATNAIQAMPAGGTLEVELAIERVEAPRAATVGGRGAGEYVVLTVADTGGGIPPQIVDRIFDPYFTTKQVGTGTGLGLSLVHGIVTGLGGAIDVASTLGSGSTFTIYLPRCEDAAEPRNERWSALPRGDGQRVLFVDDEEPLMEVATRTLADLGYAPTGFTSSAAALAAFRAQPERFDVLITDERMPEMSGSALIREVRGMRSSMPVLLMSGFLTATAKADEVLQKPLSARDLAASLARVLRL